MVDRLPDPKINKRERLIETAQLFFKLGVIGFGGPAVHIAMMEEEVVRKRKWMDRQHFLDLVGATNLIPGPNSTEMTMHIGRERAGWKGLIVAGACFIIPAVIITAFFAWIYKEFGQLPQVERFLYGIKPAIISIIVAAIIPLFIKAAKTRQLVFLGLVSVILVLFGINEILVLFGAGFLAIILKAGRSLFGFFPFVLLQVVPSTPVSPGNIFLNFLKIGSILYGSGYLLFSFLDVELVQKGLLSREVLVDSIAVGQFTPGPVFSSATFIGWQMNGWEGAVMATIGIFLPSFVFVALLNPLIPFLRRSVYMSAFLDAVNMVAVAIIFVLMFELGIESITGWKTMLICILSFFVSLKYKKVNSALIVAGGAVAGYLLSFLP